MSIDLAPETERSIRAEADARGVPIAKLVTQAVEAYVRNNKVNSFASGDDYRLEMAWAAKPDPKFFNHWVVLQGDQVVASGPDPKVIYEQARAGGMETPFLIYVSPEEHEPFAGGWMD
jgi:hypothetical protein